MSARNPARTIIVVSSKSFNTPEIIENAKKAKDWLESLVGESCWDQIFGISSNRKGMTEFGIKDTNQVLIFYFIMFILFRIFDILKPYPVSYYDKNFKNSFGVIMDDVCAGLYVVVLLVLYMVITA